MGAKAHKEAKASVAYSLPLSQIAWLRAEAERRGIPISAVVRQLIEAAMDEAVAA